MKFLAIAVLVVSSGAQAFAVSPSSTKLGYDDLSQAQKTLLHQYLEKNYGPSVNDRTAWESTLPDGVPTTFAAITQALEHTPLASGKTALSLMTSVTEIHGEVDGAKSEEQFNVAVTWSPTAYDELQQVGFAYRIGWGHAGEHGLSYQSESTGLHLLFGDQDATIGHAHVDYRASGVMDIISGDPEGHFKSYNSDVRAVGPEADEQTGSTIDNYARHVHWYGSIPGFVH
jgi:hypothetical protein